MWLEQGQRVNVCFNPRCPGFESSGFPTTPAHLDILPWFHINCTVGHGKNINEYNYQQFSKGTILKAYVD